MHRSVLFGAASFNRCNASASARRDPDQPLQGWPLANLAVAVLTGVTTPVGASKPDAWVAVVDQQTQAQYFWNKQSGGSCPRLGPSGHRLTLWHVNARLMHSYSSCLRLSHSQVECAERSCSVL